MKTAHFKGVIFQDGLLWYAFVYEGESYPLIQSSVYWAKTKEKTIKLSQKDCLGEIEFREMTLFDETVSEANCELKHVLAIRDDGELCIHEINEGVIVEDVDDDVAVRYGIGEDAFEQVYHKGQFIKGRLPKLGDRIEAHVFAWCRPHKPKGVEHFLSEEDIENARLAHEADITDGFEN